MQITAQGALGNNRAGTGAKEESERQGGQGGERNVSICQWGSWGSVGCGSCGGVGYVEGVGCMWCVVWGCVGSVGGMCERVYVCDVHVCWGGVHAPAEAKGGHVLL